MAMMFLLVLSGAAIWGVVNVLRKYLFKKRNAPVEVAVVAVMLGASVFSSLAQLAWFGVPHISTAFWIPFAATAVLNIIIIYGQTKALKMEDASIIEPLQGITPIFVILTSWLMLREFPTPLGLLGILSVVLGVYVLNLKQSDMKLPTGLHQWIGLLGKPWGRLFSSRGARLALITVMLASISLNFDKMVVVSSSPMMRASTVFLVVAATVYIISKIRGQWQKLDKGCFWPLFGIGLLIGLSNILMDWGFLYGIVPYVGSLKRFQIIVTTILAGIFLHEGDMRFRITAAAIMFAGIVLIAL
ncbi:MAG: DMT family transporter [bacterium]|nr:DMT family transporter [bacterium]